MELRQALQLLNAGVAFGSSLGSIAAIDRPCLPPPNPRPLAPPPPDYDALFASHFQLCADGVVISSAALAKVFVAGAIASAVGRRRRVAGSSDFFTWQTL